MKFKPPAALEGTENTEEKMNLIRHCGSVSSVLSNDRLVRAYPASAGEAPREWVVKKKEPTTTWKKALDQSTPTDSLEATSSRSWSTPFTPPGIR